MILFEIREQYSEMLVNMLCFCDCASFSLGFDEIYASFSEKQFKEFTYRLFFNYKKTIFARLIEI